VQGKDYSLALKCAGGLADVHFDTAELSVSKSEEAEKTLFLRFSIGQDQDRKYGELPVVGLSFRLGRVVDMNVTNRTGDRSSYTSHLCAELPIGRIAQNDPSPDVRGFAARAIEKIER
jgi:hypothetical protein